jgi:hypothetical protein
MILSSAKPPVGCSTLGTFGLLGGAIVFGLVANGLSVLQSLVAFSFGVGVLVLAAMWEWTLRRAAAAGPISRSQRLWNAAMFMAWLTAMAALAWWCMVRGSVPAVAP